MPLSPDDPSRPTRGYRTFRDAVEDFKRRHAERRNQSLSPAKTALPMSAGGENLVPGALSAKPLNASVDPGRLPDTGVQRPGVVGGNEINQDTLANIIYNESAGLSTPGLPPGTFDNGLDQAMWATGHVIMNRKAAGTRETIGGSSEKGRSLATSHIPDEEWKRIQDPASASHRKYRMARQIADFLVNTPEAFPAPWSYPHFNHRDNSSTAPHKDFGEVGQQYGPFNAGTYLNVYRGRNRQ